MKIARITNDGKLLIKGKLIEFDPTTNIELNKILRGWGGGYTVNDETPNVYYVKGLISGIVFPQTIFEIGKTYALSFKIIKTSGDILSLSGHSASFKDIEVYLDDELIGNNWVGLRNTYPNDNLEHTYKVLLTFTDTVGDSSLYVQINRDNNYSTEYTAEIYDLKLEKVEDEKVSFKPNGDLIIYGELVEKVVPLPPEDEIWIYGTFTTTYEIGQLLGNYGSNATVVDFYYDNDHYVIKASGTNLGERFCSAFNTNGNTVIFGSQFSLTAAFHVAPNATFIILNNALVIRTQNWYMQAKKIYVLDNLVETYKAQTVAIASIGEVLPLSNYTTVMPRITPDGTLVLGELIEGVNLELMILTENPVDNLEPLPTGGTYELIQGSLYSHGSETTPATFSNGKLTDGSWGVAYNTDSGYSRRVNLDNRNTDESIWLFDLKAEYTIASIIVEWERYTNEQYRGDYLRVEYSTDNQSYTELQTIDVSEKMRGAYREEWKDIDDKARYVKIIAKNYINKYMMINEVGIIGT